MHFWTLPQENDNVLIPAYVLRRYRIICLLMVLLTGTAILVSGYFRWEAPLILAYFEELEALPQATGAVIESVQKAETQLSLAAHCLWQVPNDPKAWAQFKQHMNAHEQAQRHYQARLKKVLQQLKRLQKGDQS